MGPLRRCGCCDADDGRTELFESPLRQAQRAYDLAALGERRAPLRDERDPLHRRQAGEARRLAGPRVAGQLNWFLAVDPVRHALQEAVVPPRREVEHVREIRAGEGRGRMAEVADVQPLRARKALVGVRSLVDVEREVAASLEEETRGCDRSHEVEARARPQQLPHAGQVLVANHLRYKGAQLGLDALRRDALRKRVDRARFAEVLGEERAEQVAPGLERLQRLERDPATTEFQAAPPPSEIPHAPICVSLTSERVASHVSSVRTSATSRGPSRDTYPPEVP